jgi:hypothetical protein
VSGFSRTGEQGNSQSAGCRMAGKKGAGECDRSKSHTQNGMAIPVLLSYHHRTEGWATAMTTNEHLDATYEHLPPHIRKVAIRIAQQIALTAEPVKTTLEATFTEFLGQILLHVKEWK